MQLHGHGLLAGPASLPGLISMVTEDDHSGTDKVDDGKEGEVNEVHQEL